MAKVKKASNTEKRKILNKWEWIKSILVKVLNDLKARGIRDVFIFSIDGLNRLKKAIESIFPHIDNSEVCGTSD